MYSDQNIIKKVESSLVESLENVKKLTIEAFKDESILTLLECYKLFNSSTNEDSDSFSKEISKKLKTIDFKNTLKSIDETLNINLIISTNLDLLFESISNNKEYDNDYESIQKEINDLNKMKSLIEDKNKINSFLSEFDGSLKNNVIIGMFKQHISSNYGKITENQNKYIDLILNGNDTDVKSLHVSNIKEALSKVDTSLNENKDDIKLLKVKNKLLTMYSELHENTILDKDVISVINLLDNF
jgi:hypothetical protein